MPDDTPKYSLLTATSIVIANMVGTGVFAALFFQIDGLPSGAAILVLWLAGGVVALCGGLCYAELTGLFPRSGGEYEFLTRIYHPALGFSAGICTLVIGFAAPMASVSLNLGNYFAPVLALEQNSAGSKIVAVMSIALVTAVQMLGIRAISWVQNISTLFKIGLVVLLIILPFMLPGAARSDVSFALDGQAFQLIGSGNFFAALALLYYSYTGWSASIYIASHVKNPRRNLPLSVFIGIGVVILLYVLLNFSFLYVCSFDEIRQGGDSVGNTMIAKLFGAQTIAGWRVADIFSVMMSLALVATLNAFMVISPRVAEVLGNDFAALGWLTHKSSNGAPYLAIGLMAAISVFLVLLSDLKSLLDYIGFSLAIFASLPIIGIYLLRWRKPDMPRPFRVWGYPFTPFLFVVINLAMIYYSVEVMYNGDFLYGITPEGNISISPLSASILTIIASIALYYVVPQGKKHID